MVCKSKYTLQYDSFYLVSQHLQLEMWANAQRDGHPAEYRWRPLFNAAKFGWRPLLKCRAVTLPRRETRWNCLGRPKLTKRSQPLVHRSSPYCGDICRTYCCLVSSFPIVDRCLSCEDIARKLVRWCVDGHKVNFARGKIPSGGKRSWKSIFSVGLPGQETAKHSAKFGWLPLCNVAAASKPKRETRWN